jgi:RHS repeat-associated protein
MRGEDMTARAATSRHPVIIATGEKSLDQLDFRLPGPIELEWRRQYRSGDARSDGWFGQGWTHPLSTDLWIQEDALRYWDEQGREVVLPAIAIGQEHFEAYEQFTLTRPGANHWALRHKRGLTHHFRRRNAEQWRLPLEVVQDRNLRRVLLQFSDRDFGDSFEAHATPPRPQRLIDSAGRTLHLVWTEQRQLSQVVVESGDTRNAFANYRYGNSSPGGGGLPDLLSHTDANEHTRTFSWDQHLLVGYTLATGQRFSNRYDQLTPSGRVTESLALDDGTGDWFDYNGRTTRVRDRLGRETVYVHNARQDIVAIHDAEGRVTRNAYDDEGRPEGSTDPLGRASTTSFDRRGNLTVMMDAAGNATKLEYNELDLPSKLTDAMGSKWMWQYDAHGNLIASTDPLGHTTLYEVDASGKVAAVIDALDKRTTLDWDDAGNVVAYTDCSGHTSRRAYDTLGHLLSSTDALGQRIDFVFDAGGQLQQVTQPDGARHRYSWDGQGNLIRYVDPLGRTTTWQRNGAGAPVLRVDALGNKQRYQYDQAGRMVTLTNEVGEVTRFRYDLLDRLTDEIGFDGRHQRYAYNAAGELTHLIERGGSDLGPGKVTRFERDVLGQITSRRHVGEAPDQSASSEFTYDALGRLTGATNAISDVQLAYDPLGQLLAETQTLRARVGARAFEFKHQYDALGNRTRTTLPGGRKLDYLFYGSGHLHQVDLDGKVVSDFERDALYREVRRGQGQLRSEFAYDRVGRLIAQQVLPASGTPALQPTGVANPPVQVLGAEAIPSDIQGRFKGLIERHYQYDMSGQLVQWLDRYRGLTKYSYDLVGRVTRSQIGLFKDWGIFGVRADASDNTSGYTMAANEQFFWDAASNPLPVESALGGPGSAVRGNRLLVWQDARYSYDEHGNLIERLQGKRGSLAQVRTHFTWDAAHQLIRADVAQGPDGIESTRSFDYVYDALGRRVAKIDATGAVYFAWDGDRVSLEQSAGNETTYLYHPESFVPLAQIHNGVLHHLHTDHVGTPLEATNDSGEITWRVTYQTWGGVIVEDVAEIEQRLRFQGQYFDSETGLHYNRFRYYDHEPGRFISEDPIGLDGGVNLFQYAPNPITWIDPLGLALAHVRFPESKIIKRVTIKMQGSRPEDFKEANRIAKLYGCRGKPTQTSEKDVLGDVTWHHATYNPKTNTAVMELVTTADHEATFPHAGSVSDFEKTHNVDYGTQESLDLAEKLNEKCPCK